MSDAKHTPGPWLSQYDDNGFFEISSDAVATPIHTSSGSKTLMLQTRIAFTYSEGETDEANAHLIAAAPELLEVAESILADDMLQYLPGEYVAKVRAVIAKATGARQ